MMAYRIALVGWVAAGMTASVLMACSDTEQLTPLGTGGSLVPSSSGSAGASGMGGSSASGNAGNAGDAGASGTSGAAAAMAGGMGGGGGGADLTIPRLTGTPDTKEAVLAKLARACTDDIASFYNTDGITPPATWDASKRGDIVRCAYERLVPASEIRDFFKNEAPSLNADVGAHKFKLMYWTEGVGGQPELTSAAFYMPELRVTDPSPLVVLGHGSVGPASSCAPSMGTPTASNPNGSFPYFSITHGWVVVMPDYPGLGLTGALRKPAEWLVSVSEGHALLDATQAARKLFKTGFFSSKNAIVGHSQGGHAALSAQAYASSYGAAGSIDAVVTFAPVWFSAAAWGVLLTPIATAAGVVSTSTLSYAAQYYYGHLAAYEGPTHALDAFQPVIKTGAVNIQTLLESECLDKLSDPQQGLPSLDKDNDKKLTGTDLFTTDYTQDVGNCGIGIACTSEVAKKWRDRWVADRPAISPSVPMVLWQGAKDTTVSPDLAKCGIDRIKGQRGQLMVCADATADHGTIVVSGAPWVNRYLRHVFLNDSVPPACTGIEALGKDLKCNPQLPNSTNPMDP